MSNGIDRFQGEVKSTLKSIERRLDKHDGHFEKLFDEIVKNKLMIERIKTKLYILSGAAGTIIAIVWTFIQKMKFW